jgi:hypothetical protein
MRERIMRLPVSEHLDTPWRIHELTRDFDVYDVWALPTPGGPDDLPLLVRLFAGGDTGTSPSRVARWLFAARWKLGAWFGWDRSDQALGTRVTSLRRRLPSELADRTGPEFATLPFTSVYETDREWAAEMANRTAHAVMHVGWVPDPQHPGGFRGQLAVLVKPNGAWGRAYMSLIGPLRHLFVYPPLMRQIETGWKAAPSGRPR